MTHDIHTSVMLVELNVSQWTARKMDKRVASAVAQSNHVGEDVGRYYKSLLDPAIIKQITSQVNETRKQYYKLTLPWADDGPRVLPSAMYFDFMADMQACRLQFEGLVNGFLVDYPYHREQAKLFLGSLFQDSDYPEPATLAAKFGFHLKVTPLPHAQDFRCEIGGEEVDKIRAQIEAETRATMQATVKSAFDRIMVVASQYADRLTETDGVFRDSMVDKARELVDIMPKLNFTNDPELTRLTHVVSEKLAAHDPAVLRTNMTTRTQAAAAAKNVVSDIENFFGGNQ